MWMFAPVSAAPVTISADNKSPGLTAVGVKFVQRCAAVIVQAVLAAEPFTTTLHATETVVALEVQMTPVIVRAPWKGNTDPHAQLG